MDTYILFPSLVTELCRRAGVVEYLDDTWVHSETLIYPFKIWGKGEPSKRKKINVDLVKSTVEGSGSCRSSTDGPLENIGVDINVIKELML